MFVNKMSNLYRGPSIDASYKVSVHLAKQFQGRRFFKNRPIRNKNCLWRPCLLMDREKMSIHFRGPSIDAQYQVSVHLAMRFQRRRFFRNQPIRNKNCLWRPCLLTDRDEMSKTNRGPSIDVSHQVSVHSAMRFHRRRYRLTDGDEMSNLYRGHDIDASYQVSAHLAKRLKNRPIRNKNCLWRPGLLMDRDNMNNL